MNAGIRSLVRSRRASRSTASLAPPWSGPYSAAMPAETAENGSTPRRADRAHGAGRAVLLVVGVQDEQDLERALQHRIRLVLAADAEHHVDVVADVAEVVARKLVRQSARVAEEEGRERRQLRHQPDALDVAVLRVRDVLRVGIERRQAADDAEEHPHRVRVVAIPFEELDQVGVDVGVKRGCRSSTCRAARGWAARPRAAGTPPRGRSPSRRSARSGSRGSAGSRRRRR